MLRHLIAVNQSIKLLLTYRVIKMSLCTWLSVFEQSSRN